MKIHCSNCENLIAFKDARADVYVTAYSGVDGEKTAKSYAIMYCGECVQKFTPSWEDAEAKSISIVDDNLENDLQEMLSMMMEGHKDLLHGQDEFN